MNIQDVLSSISLDRITSKLNDKKEKAHIPVKSSTLRDKVETSEAARLLSKGIKAFYTSNKTRPEKIAQFENFAKTQADLPDEVIDKIIKSLSEE